MRYRYYVVYNFYRLAGDGAGCMCHERCDKLDTIEKIIGLQASVLETIKKENQTINQVIITNFILIDEFEEVEESEI